MKTIAIGSDHRGFYHKEFIKTHMPDIIWVDVGAHNVDRSDYPEFAHAATGLILEHHADLAVLLCGTGIGMAIAANRQPFIYAGLVWTNTVAQRAKEDDNVNVLVLPSDYISQEEAVLLITTWLQASFKGDEYAMRLTQIDQ